MCTRVMGIGGKGNMIGGGYWVVRTLRSGKVIEKSQFYVGERRPRAPRRKGSTTLERKDKNMNTAVRRLARIINCNWGRGDLWLTFTYDPEKLPEEPEQADRCMDLAWRRLRRVLDGIGVQLRGFWITADKVPETGEEERLHHHAVISCKGVTVRWGEDGQLAECSVDGRELADIWGMGSIDVEPMREQDDYTPIAVYCIRQAVDAPDAKKWHATRGLKKPVVEREVVVDRARELRAPGGAVVSEVGHYDGGSGNHYIRYIRKPKAPKVGGHKEERLWRPQQEEDPPAGGGGVG